MSRFGRSALLVVLTVSLLFAPCPPASAGTQDFTLVNHTGVEIYALYLSETDNDDWEEDVLGRDVLPDGDRIDIDFRGRSACMWDILVEDEDEGSVEWSAINLCEASVVVLRCDADDCWAEYE